AHPSHSAVYSATPPQILFASLFSRGQSGPHLQSPSWRAGGTVPDGNTRRLARPARPSQAALYDSAAAKLDSGWCAACLFPADHKTTALSAIETASISTRPAQP